MIGDTVVVRTVAGSGWGRAARLEPVRDLEPGGVGFREVKGLALGADGTAVVYDGRRRLLAIFPPDGRVPVLVGGESDPVDSDGGVAIGVDGSILVRVPSAGVIVEYSLRGDKLGEWPLPTDVQTDRPMYQDQTGRIYTLTWLRPDSHGSEAEVLEGRQREALLKYSPWGALVDTLPVPELAAPPGDLTAARGGLRMSVSLPFVPLPAWTFSPGGYFITSPGHPYAVDLRLSSDSVLRIERPAEPVAVGAGELEAERERITADFHAYFPDWTWPDSLALSRTKPAIRDLVAGRDGRVWVWRSAPAVGSGSDWREPVVYDVFDPDGTYLGTVGTPDEFRPSPRPAIAGDRVLGVVERRGTQRVVLFEVGR